MGAIADPVLFQPWAELRKPFGLGEPDSGDSTRVSGKTVILVSHTVGDFRVGNPAMVRKSVGDRVLDVIDKSDSHPQVGQRHRNRPLPPLVGVEAICVQPTSPSFHACLRNRNPSIRFRPAFLAAHGHSCDRSSPSGDVFGDCDSADSSRLPHDGEALRYVHRHRVCAYGNAVVGVWW
jgi:hypothetical protein